MKKRLMWIFLGIFSVALIAVLVCLITFISKSMDASGMSRYCTENTETNATSFLATRHMEGGGKNWTEYAFWVAEDGVSDQQELYIFQKVQFGPIKSSREWDRFRLACHVSGNPDEIVSSIIFTPRDTRNRKQSTNWMVFYSSGQPHVSRCTFTVEEDGKTCTISGKGVATGKAFVTILPDLGVKDGVSRKFVKAEFFDVEGNLVETVEGD